MGAEGAALESRGCVGEQHSSALEGCAVPGSRWGA